MLLLCFASENGLQLHYTFSYPYNYMYNDFFSCFRTRIVYFAFWTFLHQSKNVPTFLEFVHEHVINNIILSSIKPTIAVNLNLQARIP